MKIFMLLHHIVKSIPLFLMIVFYANQENLEFKMADTESLTFGDSQLASEFSSIFRDYFDIDSRD